VGPVGEPAVDAVADTTPAPEPRADAQAAERATMDPDDPPPPPAARDSSSPRPNPLRDPPAGQAPDEPAASDSDGTPGALPESSRSETQAAPAQAPADDAQGGMMTIKPGDIAPASYEALLEAATAVRPRPSSADAGRNGAAGESSVGPVGRASERPLRMSAQLSGDRQSAADTLEIRAVRHWQPAAPNDVARADDPRDTQTGEGLWRGVGGGPTFRELPVADASAPWEKSLAQAVEALHEQLATARPSADGHATARDHLRLALLSLALDGDRPATARGSHPGRDSAWPHLLSALAIQLDGDTSRSVEQRRQETLAALRQAGDELGSAALLELRNVAFCSQVESYGRYTTFEQYAFRPEQEVLLYVEVENFTVEPTADEFRTSLVGNYKVVDDRGQVLVEQSLPAETETSRNRRRDYFIPYRLWMPKSIAAGDYALQLTLHDAIGDKFGQASLEFSILP